MLVLVDTCQNATLLEITCHGSIIENEILVKGSVLQHSHKRKDYLLYLHIKFTMFMKNESIFQNKTGIRKTFKVQTLPVYIFYWNITC